MYDAETKIDTLVAPKASRGPPRHSAATSHEDNDRYMREFYTALEAKNPPPAEPQARRGPPQITPITTKLIQKPSCRTNERQILSTKLGGVTESLLKDSISSVCVPVLSHQWQSGPTNISGLKIESSERPTLCMSVCNHEVAIGSSDHALYTFDINTGRKQRQLYNRNFGHSEWVTCVTHISDGRIVSGGMDNKVCVWDATGVRCKTLTGHSSSISAVKASDHGSLILSASYDKTIKAWSGEGRSLATLAGHESPILCMDWSRGAVVSGDRGSVVNLWDLHTGAKTASLKGHKGHITAVRCLGPGAENVFVSGAQDGCLRVWDVRARRCLAAISAHISPEGSGAVADILYSVPASGDLAASKLVSAGADRVVKVFDARRNFETLHRFADHKDFIYSLAVAGNVCLSGGGDGMVLAHNVDSGALLWGVGANRAAVRCIHASSTKMVVAGDDGCSMIYNFDAA